MTKCMTKALFFSLISFGLNAEPLSLILNASVAPSPKADVERNLSILPLIPTRFEILRTALGKDAPITLNDPQKLYVDFSREGDPYRLYSILSADEAERDKNSYIKEFPVTIKDLSLSTGQVAEIFLRATGFPVFQTPALIQQALLVNQFCQKDLAQNQAVCSVVFPSFQVFETNTANISSIRTKVFKNGEVSASDLARLPTQILPQRDEFIKENSRRSKEKENSKDLEGYFLYAIYHFESSLKECVDPIKNEETFEWRFSLSQASGRLALIAGDYIVEQEIQYADGKRILRTTEFSLNWGDYKSADDITWGKKELPQTGAF